MLFNEIPIGYSVLQNVGSKSYVIEGITEGIVDPASHLTEKYVVMFTEPLNIMNGGLNLDSFLLRAHRSRNTTEYMLQPISEKPSHYKFQNFTETLNVLALVMCVLIYFLTYTTAIGLNAFNFLAIYVYISLKSSLFTALDYKLAYFLFMDVHVLERNPTTELLYVLAPHLLILFSFLVSLVSRATLSGMAERSGLCNYVYYYLTYKLSIITWEIMCIPIFTTTAHILYSIGEETNPQNNTIKYVLVYFNGMILVWYLYMSYFAVNPQPGENDQKWSDYVESSHFQLFEGFHLGIDPESKMKRNYKFIYSVLKFVTLVFITAASSQIPNIIFQVVYLIYLFSFRPFRYNFFNNFNIGIESIIIVFYLYRYIVELYVGISEEIATSTDVARILLTNIVFVSAIVLTYFLLAIYEFYQRLRVFKINMKAWRRESKYAGDLPIRKTKRSAFEREKNDHENTLEIMKLEKKDTKGLPPLKPKKSGPTPDKQEDNLGNSRQLGKEKSSKKLKEKSSLLQSISLEMESPRQE